MNEVNKRREGVRSGRRSLFNVFCPDNNIVDGKERTWVYKLTVI